MHVEIVVGNIVRQSDVDALVNSANANLRFGSGVAGAIHTAAGPEVEQYCRRYSPIALGEAVVTPGFHLPNLYVIHVRPASYINDDQPEKYLDLAIVQALRVAKEAGIKSMAMPAVGTGIFRFPPKLAAEIILKALLGRAAEFPDITLVRICVVDAQMQAVFQSALDIATAGSVRN
jgi:O-acetyl-ADP-ribose deacetylase (regulator of RNase III)